MAQMIDCRVIDHGDPPPFPDMAQGAVVSLSVERFVVLQGGMQSGKASVAFIAKMPDGRSVFMEASAAMMDMMAGIARGARMKWGESVA